jgi:cytochrome c5
MKLTMKSKLLSVAAGGLLSAGVIVGCQSSPASSPSAQPEATSPAMLSADAKAPAKPKKGKAQIWAETCNRCHNTRSPDSYNGKEWAIVMTHMRVRGYLTGEDQRAILEFLQQ